MEKPIKLYIDTSVWNFALETERKDSILTNEFLQLIKKDLSSDERLEYFHKKSKQFEKEMKNVKPAKDLKTFFEKLKNKRKAG